MIWVVGNRGMLGAELAALLGEQGIPFVGSGREADIADPEKLAAFAAGRKIDWIVNCAAYTAVDPAEDEPEAARKANALGAAGVAETAERLGASLIHLSTDYVFGGGSKRAYTETDLPEPLGVYGRTKAEGEAAVRNACCRHFIVRTSWLYGRRGNNFVLTLLRLLRERDRIGMVADQRGSPTWSRDLAEFLLRIILGKSGAYGTYHYAGGGETSRYDFAVRIRDEAFSLGLLERRAEIEPLRTEEYPTRAKRPVSSVLSTEKTKTAFGVSIPPWEESLRSFLRELKERGSAE